MFSLESGWGGGVDFRSISVEKIMFSLESGWGGIDFRSISVEKIMFSLEPEGGRAILVDFSIFGFRTPFRFFVCSFVCSFVRSVVFSFLRLVLSRVVRYSYFWKGF